MRFFGVVRFYSLGAVSGKAENEICCDFIGRKSLEAAKADVSDGTVRFLFRPTQQVGGCGEGDAKHRLPQAPNGLNSTLAGQLLRRIPLSLRYDFSILPSLFLRGRSRRKMFADTRLGHFELLGRMGLSLLYDGGNYILVRLVLLRKTFVL